MSEVEKTKVLAVVYEPAVGKILNRILKRVGFSVEIAESLEVARNKINEVLYYAVITDWTQVNGEEVVKAAQEKGIQKIVIMDGGLVGEEMKQELRELGIEFVKKPFDAEEIINLVGNREKIEEILQTDNNEN